MAKGLKTGGRKAGTPNKRTAAALEAIENVFNNLGGDEALEAWARSDPDHLKAFYVQVWPKILPLQVNGPGAKGEHLHKIVREFVSAPHTDR